jgi:hypothetical protein
MKRWNVEAQNELDEIVNDLTQLVDRLRALGNKGWNEKRANVLRLAATRIHEEVLEIAEY